MSRKTLLALVLLSSAAVIAGLAFGAAVRVFVSGTHPVDERGRAMSRGPCRRCHSSERGLGEGGSSADATGGALFSESFAGGKTKLSWASFPRFSPDPLSPERRSDAPDRDGWVGVVSNRSLGGFASLAYAGSANLADYSLDAWVYVEPLDEEEGPIRGIAVRVDPRGQRFYRLGVHMVRNARLSLAYVGADTNNFPVYLREWQSREVSGLTGEAGWHRMGLRARGDRLWAYWDGRELPGSPVRDDRIDRGSFGLYANFVGNPKIAETPADELVVRTIRR